MATDQKTIDSYDRFAKGYHDHVSDPNDSIYHSYYEKPALRAELGDLTGKNILCVGCGSGVDADWLAQNGSASVTGVDISRELIAIGRQQFPHLDLHVMDMEQLDLPDGAYDTACSSLAIHYVDNMTRSLKEVYRVLKPGGVYVFSCGHPLTSAMEISEDSTTTSKLLGTTTTKETEAQTVTGDYLAASTAGTRAIDGNLGDMDVRVYHRTFAVMVEQIVASGFKIEKVVEPLPLESMRDIDPKTYETLMKLPAFIIWVVRK
ncbi:MAG: class I SAM-dependent methyltransferase [Candidatus Saccharimonadales bacterium]|jgi:ubiquinone/menaquinone biosynthesis C-methylase UbiE